MDEVIVSFQDIVFDWRFFFPPLYAVGWSYYVANGIIFILVYQACRMIFILLRNKQLAFMSKRWNSTELKDTRILILGDSTAVGTGADTAEDTLAGRLAHDFPNAQIVNLGKNGGLIRDVSDQIETVKNEKFDMVIISAGGNDVWHLSRLTTISKHLRRVLPLAKAISNHRVIFLLYNNIGDAPLFPRPLRFFLKRRCERVYSHIRLIATTEKIPVIDLFTNEDSNPFLKCPQKLFARDGIHPSSRGYEVWYHRMWLEMVKRGYRFSQ